MDDQDVKTFATLAYIPLRRIPSPGSIPATAVTVYVYTTPYHASFTASINPRFLYFYFLRIADF